MTDTADNTAPPPDPWELPALGALVDLISERAAAIWMNDALCRRRRLDVDTFFPGRGEPNAEIKAVCAACPVRTQCLDYALARGEKFGIWGGLSERQRRTVRRQRRQVA